MINLLQACLLIILAHPTYTYALSATPPPSTILKPVAPDNLTDSNLTLHGSGLCPSTPPWHFTIRASSHDIRVWLRPGPAADASVMTNLLEYSFSQVEELVEARGEAARDPGGVYHFTLWRGLILHIEADYSATLATLDYGRVADLIEYLIKYNIEGRRFCLMAAFEASFATDIGSTRWEQVIGRGRLWTH